MISVTNLAIIGISAAALGAMMVTNPDYNRALRPFVTHVAAGEAGQTRLIAGRVTGWRTADQVAFSDYGTETLRDSEGVFLIVDLSLSGTTASTMVAASWIGASGREYMTTKRIANVPGQLEDLWLQPGLESKTIAFFELPPDEVAGGALRLAIRLDPDLDGTLLLDPPAEAPAHEDVARFGP